MDRSSCSLMRSILLLVQVCTSNFFCVLAICKYFYGSEHTSIDLKILVEAKLSVND